MTSESRVQQFANTPGHFVKFKADYLKAIPDEVDAAGCQRVFLVVSTSLDSKTDVIQRLETALGKRLVGKRVGIGAHSPYSDVTDLTRQLWKSNADIIVTVGGSSYTDACKAAMLIHTSTEPAKLNNATVDSLIDIPACPAARHPTVKLIAVPTTLSAAEYSPIAGITDPVTHHKNPITHPDLAATCVILDPALCTLTPPRLWLSSGMRSVDHCIEGMCSPRCTPEIEKVAEDGLRLLIRGLLDCRNNRDDVEGYSQCQLGVWKSMYAAHEKIPFGASHAIGHHLGSVGHVAHGDTSCIMLHSVLKYNKPVNGRVQAKIAKIFWEVSGGDFEAAGLKRDTADAGDLVKAYVKVLGLPTSLGEVDVTKEEQLDQIASNTLTDLWIKTNPREISSKEQVREILEISL
ncbi:hypothetical protein BU17DRAFT_36523 [Hysterangium stoloniferum]|nr:hypothetical protein BU17DRAFT_36523 [Hysterangium stoloniferum]